MAASKMVMASLTHCRALTSASASGPARLVPHPPDLIKWVRREGGFVHPAVKIAEDGTTGLGLAASAEIPKGSDLIALPDHVPLRFESDVGDGLDSVLANLAHRVPGMELLLLYLIQIVYMLTCCRLCFLKCFIHGDIYLLHFLPGKPRRLILTNSMVVDAGFFKIIANMICFVLLEILGVFLCAQQRAILNFF